MKPNRTGRLVVIGVSFVLVALLAWQKVKKSEDKAQKHEDTAVLTFQAHQKYVVSISFMPDGSSFVSGGDKSVKLWRTDTGQLKQVLAGLPFPCHDLQLSPRGNQFVTSWQDDLTVRSFLQCREIAQGKVTWSGPELGGPVWSLFSPDGRVLLEQSHTGITVREASTGKGIKTFEVGTVLTAFSPDGSLLATVPSAPNQATAVVTIKNTRDYKTVRQLRVKIANLSVASPDRDSSITSMVFLGRRVVVGGSVDSGVGFQVWNTATGKLFKQFSDKPGVTALAASRDNKYLAVAHADGSLYIVRANDWQISQEIASTSNPCTTRAVTFSPDGSSLAVGDIQGVISLFRVNKG